MQMLCYLVNHTKCDLEFCILVDMIMTAPSRVVCKRHFVALHRPLLTHSYIRLSVAEYPISDFVSMNPQVKLP